MGNLIVYLVWIAWMFRGVFSDGYCFFGKKKHKFQESWLVDGI